MRSAAGKIDWLQVMLFCGVLAPLFYLATDRLAGRLLDGYSFAAQSMSELSAAGSPTRSLVLSLNLVAALLMIAFGVGVWRAGDQAILPHITSGLLIANAALGLIATLFFPTRFGLRPGFGSPGVIIMFLSVVCFVLAMLFGAAALGGCQSLHTNSYDEALCLPTEQAVTVALRTQQIVAEESGATDSIDPLAGSYMVEALTDKIEKQVNDYLEKIDNMGGTLKAIEKNYIQKEIQQSSYRFQKEIESNERVYVGINKYTMEEAPPANLLKVDMKVGQAEAEKLRKMRAARDAKRWEKALENLRKVSEKNENVMSAVIEAVKAEATIGEICDVWREIYGEYKPKQSF